MFGRQSLLDDTGLSTDPQPGAAILSAPPAVGAGATADFAFAANDPGASLFCKVDGGASAPCSSPVHLDGVTLGDHVFTLIARNAWGVADTLPYSWRALDRDRDGIADANDNCPDEAN